jgi:hypothetical protein
MLIIALWLSAKAARLRTVPKSSFERFCQAVIHSFTTQYFNWSPGDAKKKSFRHGASGP